MDNLSLFKKIKQPHYLYSIYKQSKLTNLKIYEYIHSAVKKLLRLISVKGNSIQPPKEYTDDIVESFSGTDNIFVGGGIQNATLSAFEATGNSLQPDKPDILGYVEARSAAGNTITKSDDGEYTWTGDYYLKIIFNKTIPANTEINLEWECSSGNLNYAIWLYPDGTYSTGRAFDANIKSSAPDKDVVGLYVYKQDATAKGTVVFRITQCTATVPKPTPALSVDVKSVGTKTKNLLDLYSIMSAAGRTLVVSGESALNISKDGTIKVHKVASYGLSAASNLSYTISLPAGKYTLCAYHTNPDSKTTSKTGYPQIGNLPGAYLTTGNATSIFTVTEDQAYKPQLLYAYYGSSTAEGDLEYKLAVYEGSYTDATMPEYEPYGYRIDIIDDANLFDAESTLPNGTIWGGADRQQQLSGYYGCGPIKVKGGNYYTRRATVGGANYYKRADGSSYTGENIKDATIKVPDDAVEWYFNISTSTSRESVIIVEGIAIPDATKRSATVYAPAPLRKIGDFADTLALSNNQVTITRQIGRLNLTSGLNWVAQPINYPDTIGPYIKDITGIHPSAPIYPGGLFCNIAENDLAGASQTSKTNVVSLNSSRSNLLFNLSGAGTNLTEFRAWLDSNEAYVLYPLTTQQTEVYTVDSLNIYETASNLTIDSDLKPSALNAAVSYSSTNIYTTPDPNHLLEITSVGTKTKNLFDINELNFEGQFFTKLSNGYMLTWPTGTVSNKYLYTSSDFLVKQLKPSTKYYYSYDVEIEGYNNLSGSMSFGLFLQSNTTFDLSENKTAIFTPVPSYATVKQDGIYHFEGTFTTGTQENLDLQKYLVHRISSIKIVYTNIMISEEEAPYEPYGHKLSISYMTTNNLWKDSEARNSWILVGGVLGGSTGDLISSTIVLPITTRGVYYYTSAFESGADYKYRCGALYDSDMNFISGTRVINTSGDINQISIDTSLYPNASYIAFAHYRSKPLWNLIRIDNNSMDLYNVHTVYLSEPLRKVGEYTDELKMRADGSYYVERNIGSINIDSSWVKASFNSSSHYRFQKTNITNMKPPVDMSERSSFVLSDSYSNDSTPIDWSAAKMQYAITCYTNLSNIYLYNKDLDNAASTSQTLNGRAYYVLNTPTTEDVVWDSIPEFETEDIEFISEVQPSSYIIN